MADEEDFFSDDDLDIPDNTLHELERNAIASTQRPKSAGPVSRPFQKQTNNVSAPSRPRVVKQSSAWRPPQPRPQPPQAAPTGPPASAPAPPSSDYGFDDEDVIDLDEPSMVIQPASGPSTSRNIPHPSTNATAARYDSKAALDPETEAAFAAADAELGAQQNGEWAHAPHLAPPADNVVDHSGLQARIAELEAEQARLRQSEQQARNAAATKLGEIAIVRANQEKTTKEYERRIAVMQKLHADEAARVKAELEAGKKEREKMETDNRFLQHDLAQEAERAKRLNGPGKARTALAVRQKETPKKAKRTGLGDGFEDEEVRLVSPSKSKEKSKESTPKHGTKRKRTANDSPVAALSFTQPPEPIRRESTAQSSLSAEQPAVATLAVDNRFDFMQRLLSHSPYEGHERTLEALTKHAFPAMPAKSLSSALMDALAYPTAPKEAENLPLKLSRASMKLWARCQDEEYHAPLYLLLDLVNFVLYLERSVVVSQLIEEAVPLCIKSINLVAFPTARASMNPTFASSMDRDAHDKLSEEVCVDDTMDFLLRLCQAAELCGDRINVFWQHMELHFTLLMLNKAQPLSQIITALRVLATSTLSTTFGPISDDPQAQAMQEAGMIDRLTSLLFEMPEVPHDESAYTEEEIAELRIEILNVLLALCLTDHGGLLLAQNRSAIGRLIRLLDGQINKMYTLPSTIGMDEEKAKKCAHALVAQTVNMALRLVYHLLRTHEDSIDLNQKLSVINGGYHRFLICMTRIAFSEQLVLEYGIENEVVEAAHTILDNMLSPEEGEAIVKAVETPRGTRGSGNDGSRGGTTEKDTSREETPMLDGDTTMSDPG